MSLKSSEHNYKIAKSLYNELSDNFYEIENNDGKDETYLMDVSLDLVKRLNRAINKINLSDLERDYDKKILDIIDNNVQSFKEGSYYIERSLESMLMFDKLKPLLGEYLDQVDWDNISDDKEDAVVKFGSFLTSPENLEQYKNINKRIISSMLSKKDFSRLFNRLESRIQKPVRKVTNQKHPHPPEMWDEENIEKWEKMKNKRRKEADEYDDDEFPETIKFNESFISLEDYKKYIE